MIMPMMQLCYTRMMVRDTDVGASAVLWASLHHENCRGEFRDDACGHVRPPHAYGVLAEGTQVRLP